VSLHVTTFYSFKGGVGRTQALVNAAAWIATKQRPAPADRPKVLMVDFDLEAAGIQYVEGLTIVDPKPGIVDFIHDYLDNAGEVPNIREYVSQAILPNGVQVDVILAGDQARYYRRFGQLRFDALWQRQHGCDLFIDMKCQLDELGYEFMLVDSRTGMCDTSELCTLTLPDQVVVVFAPNRQNLAGTKFVIERIHQVPTIEILGVASRVRRTDDEHGALRVILSEFAKIFEPNGAGGSVSLGSLLKEPSSVVVVHEDPQQRLLADAVAVVSYPRSGLAKEYRRIARRIVARNPRSQFWASAIAKDAPSRRKMHIRYGIPARGVDAWRTVAAESMLGNSEAMWQLAVAHPAILPVGAVDADRMLDIDLQLGFASLLGKGSPPADAIRWILNSLELGDLERRVFRDASQPDVLRSAINGAIDRCFATHEVDGAGLDALRFLVWTLGLHERIDQPVVVNALRDPTSYQDGSCFGGFRGHAATSYILQCGDYAGVDWSRLAEVQDCRRWLRTAAIDTGRLDLGVRLLEPTPSELKYLSHWLAWASDLLAACRLRDGPAPAKVAAAILQHESMLDQLRFFWLPGVGGQEPVWESDQVVGIERTIVVPPRGGRPKQGVVPLWLNQIGGRQNAWEVDDIALGSTLDNMAFEGLGHHKTSYPAFTWLAMVPSAATVLRAIGDEDHAAKLEKDALERLDAAGIDQIAKEIGERDDQGSTSHRPPIGSPRTDSSMSRYWDAFPWTARAISPIHRSAIDVAGLYASLRDHNASPVGTGMVVHSCSGPIVKAAFSRIAALGSVNRHWSGWSTSQPNSTCTW